MKIFEEPELLRLDEMRGAAEERSDAYWFVR